MKLVGGDQGRCASSRSRALVSRACCFNSLIDRDSASKRVSCLVALFSRTRTRASNCAKLARSAIRGTDGNDLICSLGGSDLLFGSGGEDWFVFGAETRNSRRETDIIRSFDWQEDAIVLDAGTEIRSIRDFGAGVLIKFEDDRDSVLIFGPGLDEDNIRILQSDVLENWV